MEDTIKDYTFSEEYKNNVEKQFQYYSKLTNSDFEWDHKPFNDWGSFMAHYTMFRAALVSFTKNPDTKDDPDFQELCRCWECQRFCDIHFHTLDQLYFKLKSKPLFEKNPMMSEMRGHFLKSVYVFFNDESYTSSFFKIE